MLRAALAVFAEKGYEQATVEEVAERAEFGKGTLYNYFPGGKEEILFALFDELSDGLAALAREHFEAEAESGRPARAVFRDLIARMIRHFGDNREAFFLLIKEAQRLILGAEREKVAHLLAQRDRVLQAIEAAVERAVSTGEFKPLPAHAVAHVILGNVNGYLVATNPQPEYADLDCAPEEARRFTPDEAADFIAEILFDGLLRRA
jgi:TetR/AcrR family transcriptional regulator, repressor of fatR-cypB operon